ncbi:MAG TPA: non-homologous end-joining DNA ligase [Candidatus Dormibacteraeota bacterium]|nr:non-homologous end-joining DNA ligase [Candidatus Dormibacteraeota bacterium]
MADPDQLQIELESFPGEVRPMQAASAEAPFSSSEYVFEVKWDGLRCVLFRDPDGTVRLQDRGLRDLTADVPEVVAAARRVPPGSVIDGELVATDNDGRPDYPRLRQRLAAGARMRDEIPTAYLAFDALYLEGRPQQRQPLIRRRARLAKAVEGGGHMFVPQHIEEDGVELFEACLERGLEGVVAKHMQSPYVPGQRSPFWLKVKAVKSDDFVVIGWTGDKPFDALVVGFYEEGRLLPCGTVGGGYDEDALRTLRERLAGLGTEDSPLEPPPIMMRPVHWVRPELVVSIRYSEWSPDGTLRFPIFNGMRPEVHPAEAVRHRPRVVISGHVRPGSAAYDLTRFPF